MRSILAFLAVMVLAGCSAATTNVGSLILPTSLKKIDVVQHRSDSKECPVGWVLQTYDAKGELIDSKSGHGNALHCQLFQSGIQAGAIMGGAALLRPSSIDNSNEQGQAQAQGQIQSQKQGKDHGRGRGGHGGYNVE